MQDTLWCYLKLVYVGLEWIVEIPKDLKVETFIDILNQYFPSDLHGSYLYEIKSGCVLELTKKFNENNVVSGDYLYLI